MSDLIKNRERLRSVRAKINATINPFSSRAQFESSSIPVDVVMIYVVDGEFVYRLVKSAGGEWVSGDGAKWDATIDAGLALSQIADGISAARAWAEGDTPPDPENEDSKSAKGWAEAAAASAALVDLGALDDALEAAQDVADGLDGLSAVAFSGNYLHLENLPDLSVFDEVEQHANLGVFPTPGASTKFYLAQDSGLLYRWTGSDYTVISAELALGETPQTAYRGDRGKIAYDHSQETGNPHGTTKADVGLGSVDNTSDADKPVSNAAQAALDLKANASALGAMAALGKATAAQIMALTNSELGVTLDQLLAALVEQTPDGTSNWAPDWATFFGAEWVITANRVLSNPTGVIPYTTRAITVKSSSGTTRTMTFGSNFKGDLPAVVVTDTSKITLFLFAKSATEILVSDKPW